MKEAALVSTCGDRLSGDKMNYLGLYMYIHTLTVLSEHTAFVRQSYQAVSVYCIPPHSFSSSC